MESEQPVEVTLRFRSEKDLDDFLGGLLDGWGEGMCELEWESGKPASECRVFDVTHVWTPDDDEEEA